MQTAGPAALISYLVAGTLIILVMWALGEMAAANPRLFIRRLVIGSIPGNSRLRLVVFKAMQRTPGVCAVAVADTGAGVDTGDDAPAGASSRCRAR